MDATPDDLADRPMPPAADATDAHEGDGAAVTVVDAIGLPCPQPVIELARAVAGVEVGARVRLLATDPAVRVDVPVWCRLKRQRLHAQSMDGAGVWTFEVDRLR
jgi:tRNA 2-thiouridine synthesizing protein A